MKTKVFLGLITAFILGTASGLWLSNQNLPNPQGLLSPRPPAPTEVPRPLLQYSFPGLRQKQFEPKQINLQEKIAAENGFSSWIFSFNTEAGWVSGQLNIPEECSFDQKQNLEFLIRNSGCPSIILLRGYVDKEEYRTGVGTKNAAAVLAQNGYLTLAPDFLGYGSSDPEPEDELEARFQRIPTVLQLMTSLGGPPTDSTNPPPASLGLADPGRIGLWGHSNGGQIALSVLAVTGRPFPTTLWAPVSKPFPYSILYYTDELDDHGKYLRKLVADFELLYNSDLFSVTDYLDWITSPLQIHQGTADDAVPPEWSEELVTALTESPTDKDNPPLTSRIDVNLYVYPGADHNLKPSWDTAINRDLNFFAKFF